MTPVANHLPLNFSNRRGRFDAPSNHQAQLPSEEPNGIVARHGGSDAVGNVGATVAKFNAAFPVFAIQQPDRDSLAVMRKYSAIMGRGDIANELEYHLNRPLDCDLSTASTTKIGRW